jgi:tetratricopeptide (TPR) repeat protein
MYAPGLAVSTLLFVLLGVFVALPIHERAREFTLPFSFETVGRFLAMTGAGVVALLFLLASTTSLSALTSDVLVNRSILLFSQNGNVAESSALVQRALGVWSSNDRAHRAGVELGILELARLAQSAPTDTEAQAALQAALSDTIEHGLAAVSIDGSDYQNWLTLAQLYQQLAGVGIEGAYEQAQAAYMSAKEENPTNPLPLFRLGQLEVARGNRAEALTHLDAALALKPDFAPAHFLRSQLLAQDQRIEEAVQSAAAAVQLVPEDPLGWYNLGVVLYIGGSFSEAGTAFAQAVTLQADYSNALFMLALSFHKVGQPEQAIAALTRVLELNPNDTSVPAMIANLEAGKDPFDGQSAQ